MIGNSRVTYMIDQATSNDLSRPDPSLIAQACQEISLKSDK